MYSLNDFQVFFNYDVVKPSKFYSLGMINCRTKNRLVPLKDASFLEELQKQTGITAVITTKDLLSLIILQILI